MSLSTLQKSVIFEKLNLNHVFNFRSPFAARARSHATFRPPQIRVVSEGGRSSLGAAAASPACSEAMPARKPRSPRPETDVAAALVRGVAAAVPNAAAAARVVIAWHRMIVTNISAGFQKR